MSLERTASIVLPLDGSAASTEAVAGTAMAKARGDGLSAAERAISATLGLSPQEFARSRAALAAREFEGP